MKPLLSIFVWPLLLSCSAFANAPSNYVTYGFDKDPYHYQMDTALKRMSGESAEDRAEAIEELSFLRAYEAADAVEARLKDTDAAVRREAAMNLGWTGGRRHLKPLVGALADADWSVRQAAGAALFNLSGMSFPFDGLADESTRSTQIRAWSDWVEKLRDGEIPEEVDEMLAASAPLVPLSEKFNWFKAECAARALGALGGKAAAERITPLLANYLEKDLPVENRAEKLMVEAYIRALGRLGGESAKKTLIRLLDRKQWAPYAAEALGNAGGEDAAAALLSAYPGFSRNPEGHLAKGDFNYNGVVKNYYKNDAPQLQGLDCLPFTAHEILRSLCRIDFKTPENMKALQSMVPNIVATTPNEHDATIIYNVEPWQMMSAWLLEKAGARQGVVDAAFAALGQPRKVDASLPNREIITRLVQLHKNKKPTSVPVSEEGGNPKENADNSERAPYAGQLLAALCRSEKDIPLLIALLDHENGFVRIDAARALKFLGKPQAVVALMNRLAKAPDDSTLGYSSSFTTEEYQDTCPRWKAAFLIALGGLNAPEACPLIVRYLNNGNNPVDIQYAAALALSELGTPDALSALQQAELTHPFYIVRIAARQALMTHHVEPLPGKTDTAKLFTPPSASIPTGDPKALVFLKADQHPPNRRWIPANLQGYTVTDSGPVYRVARNIFKLAPVQPDGKVTALTHFKDGYVARLAVSYDGKKLLFCRREQDDPWWHIFEINADGSDLRQITSGPYHDADPYYMPDGRIVFSTSRLGMRDEYHGYAALGLATMNSDGSDIRVIGLNLGRDAEPVVNDDGRILFTRLELFYSRVKTEWNLLSVFPDGTHPVTLYGPERRDFWMNNIIGGESLNPPRHRVLRITQPQPYTDGQYLINSFSGPMLTGPGRMRERILEKDNQMAITTPYPLDNGKLLVAAGARPLVTNKKTGKTELDLNAAVDYGLYYMDVQSGKLTLIYNDPATSEFEARPLQPHKMPPVVSDTPPTEPRQYSGEIFCKSVFSTQEELVKERGRYVRIVEGLPTVIRNQSQNGGIVWRNHGGAISKVLGTIPLASDGSFAAEVPADHLFHIQVLDSDRQVIGNELLWQHVRPAETRGCIGCHERPDSSPQGGAKYPSAFKQPPIACMPTGEVMSYHAKAWFKGFLPPEREERMRTVNSVNLLGSE